MYAFTQDVPIDRAFYERVTDALGSAAAPGLIVHLAIERPEGGLRYVDVWESEAQFGAFAESRLMPVVKGKLDPAQAFSILPGVPKAP